MATSEEGCLFLAVKYKGWTDEQYQIERDKYEVKHQCMLRNGIHVLTSSMYSFFLDYVSRVYWSNYIRKFKNSSSVFKYRIEIQNRKMT